MKQVFIINRTDAIGDTLLTLPVAAVLKKNYPDSRVVFLVSERARDLFVKLDFVDAHYVIDRRLGLWKKLFLLRRIFKVERPTHFFHIGGMMMPVISAWLSRVPFRGGLLSRYYTFLFLNAGVRQRRSLTLMHEVDYNLELLMPILSEREVASSLLIPDLHLKEEEQSSARSILTELEVSHERPFILIHPGMMGHTLNWPGTQYGKLVALLDERLKGEYAFVISYTSVDLPYIEAFKAGLAETNFKGSVHFYDGSSKTLRHYMGLLSLSSLFIGPSTGTTHLAVAMKRPVVGIYSPIKVQSALRWGPMNRSPKMSSVMVPEVVCGEPKTCSGEECPYYECMGRIEVKDVADEVIRLLGENQ